jgi:hypothetical protein
MIKKPILLMNGHTDEIYTPKKAIYYLIPYLNKNKVIWESAWGTGKLAQHFKEEGFKVVKEGNYDIEVTNPPYSDKEGFLERAYNRGKPFAFLMPLTALEGKKRGLMYRNNGIQLIIPNKRINFITPNGGKSSWFQTAWFCWKLNLPKDLMFIELEEKYD